MDDDVIIFTTAWSAVTSLICKLSEMFKDVMMKYAFADEDNFGYCCGSMTIENGKIRDLYFPKGGSTDALNLTGEVVGWDIRDASELEELD